MVTSTEAMGMVKKRDGEISRMMRLEVEVEGRKYSAFEAQRLA